MGLSRVHWEILILEPGPDKPLQIFLQFIKIEATLIVVAGNITREQVVFIEYLPRKLGVRLDTFINRLYDVNSHLRIGHTIPSTPSMSAMSPPVLVPPMRSKYSLGLWSLIGVCPLRDFFHDIPQY
jgi:hypothetical protein